MCKKYRKIKQSRTDLILNPQNLELGIGNLNYENQ